MTKNRHIPVEIIEEILLNLPYKSLLRFSSVSKSWNSTILEPGFVKRYQKNFLYFNASVFDKVDSTCPISSIPWDNINNNNNNNPSALDVTAFVTEFDEQPYLMAMCDELWLAYDVESLFLLNPNMRTRRKIPNPLLMPSNPRAALDFSFGLGYDAVSDDYKVLKAPKEYSSGFELYSLRSDSWREILPGHVSSYVHRKYETSGVCVSGTLHWVPGGSLYSDFISFDLSTEKFGVLAKPPHHLHPPHQQLWKREVRAVRGKLCVSYSYYEKCVVWVMEEYGDAQSWTNKFTLKCGYSIMYGYEWIVPLYYYDNGEVLVRVNIDRDHHYYRICLYKDDRKTRRELICRCCFGRRLNIGCVPYAAMPSSRQRILFSE